MEKKILYTESAPEKSFLWLHHKNNNLVLEVFGNNGWESVCDDSYSVKEPSSPIKVELPALTDKCPKADLIATVVKLTDSLIKAGIIETE